MRGHDNYINILVTMPARDILLRHFCKMSLTVGIRCCTLLSLMNSWSDMTEAHSQYVHGQDSVAGVNEPQSLLFSFSNGSQDTPACEHLLGTLKLFSHQSLNSIHYQMLSSNVLAAFAFSVNCRSSHSISPERIPLYAYCSVWRCSPNEARDRCP